MRKIDSTRDLLEATYGVRTGNQINPVTGTVGTTPTRIAQYNPRRLGLIISNTGAGTIVISSSKDVSLTNGLVLAGNGASVAYIWEYDFEDVCEEVWAIASAANTVHVREVFMLPSKAPEVEGE